MLSDQSCNWVILAVRLDVALERTRCGKSHCSSRSCLSRAEQSRFDATRRPLTALGGIGLEKCDRALERRRLGGSCARRFVFQRRTPIGRASHDASIEALREPIKEKWRNSGGALEPLPPPCLRRSSSPSLAERTGRATRSRTRTLQLDSVRRRTSGPRLGSTLLLARQALRREAALVDVVHSFDRACALRDSQQMHERASLSNEPVSDAGTRPDCTLPAPRARLAAAAHEPTLLGLTEPGRMLRRRLDAPRHVAAQLAVLEAEEAGDGAASWGCGRARGGASAGRRGR